MRPQSLRIRKQWIAVCRQYSKVDRPRVVSTNPVLATRACVRTISCPPCLGRRYERQPQQQNGGERALCATKEHSRPSALWAVTIESSKSAPVERASLRAGAGTACTSGGTLGQPRRPELKVGGVYASTKFHKQGSSRNNSAPSSPRITQALQITCRRLDENSGRRTWTEIEANTRFKSNLFAFFLQTERSRKGR